MNILQIMDRETVYRSYDNFVEEGVCPQDAITKDLYRRLDEIERCWPAIKHTITLLQRWREGQHMMGVPLLEDLAKAIDYLNDPV